MTTVCPKEPATIRPRVRYGDKIFVRVQSTNKSGGDPPNNVAASNYLFSLAFNPAYPNPAHNNYFLTLADKAQAVELVILPAYAPESDQSTALMGKEIPIDGRFLLETTHDVTIDSDSTRIYLGGGYWHTYYFRSFNSGSNNEYWRFIPTGNATSFTDGIYWGQSYTLLNMSYNQYAWVDWGANPIQLSSSSDNMSTADIFTVLPADSLYFFCQGPSGAGGGCSIYCGNQIVTERGITCTPKGCSAASEITGMLVPIYATRELCQQSCVPQRWACIDGKCQQTTDPAVAGDYTSQQQCEERTKNCTATTYSCSAQQTCQQDVQGKASSKEACQQLCKRTYACDPSSLTCFWDPTANSTNQEQCSADCAARYKPDPPPTPQPNIPDGDGNNNGTTTSTIWDKIKSMARPIAITIGVVLVLLIIMSVLRRRGEAATMNSSNKAPEQIIINTTSTVPTKSVNSTTTT